MSKQHQTTIVFLLALIAGLLFVGTLIGGFVAYRDIQVSTASRRQTAEAHRRVEIMGVIRKMEKDGRPQEEIDAYALHQLGSGQ